MGGVTLDAIMAQFQHMDARLNTIIAELYQVNTHVSCIARRQARLGGFVESLSPPHKAFEDVDDDDGEDGDTSSSNADEMPA